MITKTGKPVLFGEAPARRVCVVGAGTRFLSGISYYTYRLTNALAESSRVSAILMRQLLPTRLYPGRDRVKQGVRLTNLAYAPEVKVFDGVDWFWLPSLFRALNFFRKEKPEVVVFQWWTGVVLHSYLALALAARLSGAKVVIEFHEVQDTGEARLRLARLYMGLVSKGMVRLADGFVIHSEFDRPQLEKSYKLGQRPVELIPHGPYDHYQLPPEQSRLREAPEDCCNLLFFGVIRPYKGLEDLIRAFEAISPDQIDRYWLTVVGETWEGWTLPTKLIEESRYRDRITFINRYVPDEEVAAHFSGADAVVLPYHRSSASGPLHVAMSEGLPVVVTRVGGLVEASSGYEGVFLVPPQDPASLGAALEQVAALQGQRFQDPHSWERTAASYNDLFAEIEGIKPDLKEVAA